MAAQIVKKRRPRLKLAVVDKSTLKKRADALFSFIYENVTILTESHKEAANGLFFCSLAAIPHFFSNGITCGLT